MINRRHRWYSPTSGAVVAAVAAACLVSACAAQPESSGPPAAAGGSAARSTPGPVTAAAVGATIAVHAVSDARPHPASAGATVAAISVTSFTATSPRRWWVAGSDGHGRPGLLRTDDGGARWSRVALPAAAVAVPAGAYPPQVAFSTPAAGLFTVGGGFWVTADAGRSWRYGGPADAAVTQIAASPHAGYALLQGSHGWYLTRAAAGSVHLDDVLRPAQLGSTTPRVATSGAVVVVVAGDRTWRSTDGGRRFRRSSGPCTPDLGGTVSAAAATAVAWCATGMDGAGYVSTNSGATFRAVPHAVGANAAAAATTGAGATVVFAAAGGGLDRVTAAGVQKLSGRRLGPVTWIGFAGPAGGFALAGSGTQRLWHTTDAGSTWSPVTLAVTR